MEAIAKDFQGWPVYKKTLRELLIELGAEEKDGVIGFKSDALFLDNYITTLQDDGMGYGIYEQFFTDAEVVDNAARLWRDAPDPNFKNEQ